MPRCTKRTKQDVVGVVYLLHFSAPYRHARHYVGWASDLQPRLEAHLRGEGARLITVILQAGLSFDLVRTWVGPRALERRIKSRKEAPRLCPICQMMAPPRRRYAPKRKAAAWPGNLIESCA